VVITRNSLVDRLAWGQTAVECGYILSLITFSITKFELRRDTVQLTHKNTTGASNRKPQVEL